LRACGGQRAWIQWGTGEEATTVRVMVLRETGPIEARPLHLAEVEKPAPGRGQVLVRVLACGVCRTDLHTVEGELELPKLPVVPGHQVVGIIEELGEGVQTVRVGERVGVPWLFWTCGECEFCRRGQSPTPRGRRYGDRGENLCENAKFTGLHVDGGYADYMVADGDFVYPVSEALSPVEAAPLLCGGVIGMRALKLSGIAPGERLGMWGFGGSAHVTMQVARHWGGEVYVFTRGEEHRRLALELGAAWAGRPDEQAPCPVDAAIVFAPAGEIVPLALRAVRKGGTVALAGIHMSPIPEMPYELLYHERVLRSVANSTRQDVRDLLEVAAEIPIRSTTQAFPLEQANEALLALKQGRVRGTAVLDIGGQSSR